MASDNHHKSSNPRLEWRKPKPKPVREMREKISLGIALCKIDPDTQQMSILLICKRYTYSYNQFIHGHYDSSNDNEIKALFNGMTFEEKIDIISLNFQQIWHRVWINKTFNRKSFLLAKSKFDNTFVADNGLRLRKLLDKSTHEDRIWEIPKGRKLNRTESDIHCAIREFEEETCINKDSYRLLDNTMSYTYIDDNVKYINVYHLAIATSNIVPTIDFKSQSQVDEISEIKWMDINQIKFVDKSIRLFKFTRALFKRMKKLI
jgi:8-oxo-dGTP pyrophosphatase MutT (NUDIX family)